ncbi:MAG: hypothetical protein J5658_09855, partial [Prevotella sp.]|nr:hypothetical protein [Prevotella sp.]
NIKIYIGYFCLFFDFRNGAAVRWCGVWLKMLILTFEINWENACKYAEFFVPLQRQMKGIQSQLSNVEIASINIRKCTH